MKSVFSIAAIMALSILCASSATRSAFATAVFLPPAAIAAGSQCDFTAIKDSLYKTESAADGGYTAIGPDTAYGKPLGKYQFIPPTQEAMLKRCPGGDQCSGDKILEERCWPLQECIMDEYLKENLDRVRNNSVCSSQLGKTVTGTSADGKETLTCQVTEAGLLAAQHLGGPGACKQLRDNGGTTTDNLGTSIAYYTCKHGGLPVPGACTPAPYDPTVQQGVGTKAQYDYLVKTGQSRYITVNPDALHDWWVGGLMLMAEQFTANMTAQLAMIGKLFDGKHQLETQRLFQQKTAEAHKDYQPSEQMCTFGTFARDLTATTQAATFTKTALSTEIMGREAHTGAGKGLSPAADQLSRIAEFRKTFCNPNDNNGGGGLQGLCLEKTPVAMQNRDIDYTRTIDQKLSLDIDLTDDKTTDDEKAVFALVDNLFAHTIPETITDNNVEKREYQYRLMNIRSIIAMRGIARNSISNIIALKTAVPKDDTESAAPYMRALLVEFGMTEPEITKFLGDHPSLYAQMEVLTKMMYQNPNFWVNLIDKPTNVARIRAAMKAIKLMQDRDIQASLQRREQLLSMILELRLRDQANKLYTATDESLFNAPIPSKSSQ